MCVKDKFIIPRDSVHAIPYQSVESFYYTVSNKEQFYLWMRAEGETFLIAKLGKYSESLYPQIFKKCLECIIQCESPTIDEERLMDYLKPCQL
jgi:hypothetical protein